MSDELEICAAAFFRIKGKDVVTDKEFIMSAALDFKWMSVKESENLLKTLVSKGLLTRNNGYVKPAKDLSAVQVPIAYRPSDAFRKSLAGTVSEPPAVKSAEPTSDVFMELIAEAVANGIPKSKFVAESNVMKKRLGVEICVAALLLLRDNGVDIGKWEDRVYTQVREKIISSRS